jgi:rod shape-determining protein MreD
VNVSLADVAKGAAVVFLAAVVQVTVLSTVSVLGGTPDLVLVTLVAVALLRGSIFGAIAGFGAGLIVDTANLETLGLTSLLLTLAGYWIGRYGETTGRDRTHAPFVSVAVVTALYSFGALILHYMLDDPVSARVVLIDSLPPALLFNLLLTLPVYALCRRLFGSSERAVAEVQLLG